MAQALPRVDDLTMDNEPQSPPSSTGEQGEIPSSTEQQHTEEGSMDSTTQSQPGPNAGWQQPQTGTRPPLVRSRTDRKIAGVAGGLAAYLGVEPLWIRIAFVVISIPGGLGVLLYLLGWVLIPEEGEPAAIGEGLLEHLRRAPTWLAILLFVVAGIVFFDRPWGPPAFWAVALIGVGIWLYHNDTHRQPPVGGPPVGGPPAGPAAGGTPTGGNPPVFDAPPPPPSYQAAAGAGYPSYAGYAARPVAVPRTRRPRSFLGRYTAAAVLVVLGLTAALDNIGAVNVPGRVYPALALLVVGAGLIVGAFWGRSRLLILAGLLILPVAAAASLVKVPLRGGTGQRLYAPTTLRAVSPEYHLGAGQLHLDLTQLPAAAWTSTVHTRVSVAAGDIEVVVPSDVAVDFRGHTGAGDIYLFDVVRNGIDVTLQSLVPGAQATSPRLVLDAEASVGQIRVIRGAAPVPVPVAPAVTSTAG
jgi:phage shock protein PspC (stress-responsive transcriptional regulator)